MFVDLRRQGVRPDLHAEFFQVPGRPGRLLLGEHREDARTRLDQDDPRKPGVDVAEVPREREPAHFPDGARQLHAGRAAAYDDEGQQLPARFGIVGPFRRFESAQQAPADLRGLRDRLQAGCVLLPGSVTEVTWHRPATEQQVIERQLAEIRRYGPGLQVNPLD